MAAYDHHRKALPLTGSSTLAVREPRTLSTGRLRDAVTSHAGAVAPGTALAPHARHDGPERGAGSAPGADLLGKTQITLQGQSGSRHRLGEKAARAVRKAARTAGRRLTWDEAQDVADEDQERGWAAKTERYQLRAALWGVTSLPRVRACGREAIGGGVGLRISTESGTGCRTAGFSSLETCASVWACPVCSARVAARRGQEIADVLGWATEQGHSVGMITLTVRHGLGHDLAHTLGAVVDAWGAVTSGDWTGESLEAHAKRVRAWEDRASVRAAEQAHRDAGGSPTMRLPRVGQRPVRRVGIAEKWGVLGWVRVIECTHGDEHGWHPHVHVVVVLEGEQREEVFRRLGEAIWGPWERALQRRGLDALRDFGGLDVRASHREDQSDLAAYLVKSLAMEATSGHLKTGRSKSSRTPMQIAGDFVRTGDADDLDLWHEWETATYGRRQIGWSNGLREMAGLASEEESDEEIVAEEIGESDALVIDARDWADFVAAEAGELLVTAERDGITGARQWLDERGAQWWTPPPPDDDEDPPTH